MTHATTQLLNEALRLPDIERADLAAQLIDSLDPELDDGVEAAWDREIRERIDEVQSGTVTGIPWSEARRQILEDPDDRDAS